MERIHKNSSDVHKSEVVGLFKVPGTQTDIESGYWKVLNPIQSITGATEVHFGIGGGTEYTDLANSYLKIKFSVKTGIIV